jgi:DNA gyrase subunit B
VDVEPKTGLSGVEVVMTKLHAGGKFGGGSYAASGGLHGVGASVVNALSSRLDVEVDRDGATHAISFRRGVPGVFDGDGPNAPFTAQSGMTKGRRSAKKAGVTGTRIRYWADRQIFLKEARISLPELHDRARQTAFLVPGLTLVVRDERRIDGAEPSEETFHYAGGISEFCEYLAPDRPISDTLRLTGSGTFTETVPVLDDAGHMTPKEVQRTLDVDVALRWGTEYDTVVKSFVNIIITPKGGTHATGFERALLKTVNEQLRAVKLLRVNDDPVVKDDILEGLTAVVTVRLAEPQFEGQTKEVLGTPAAARIVTAVVSEKLSDFLTSNHRNLKPQARAVLEKIAAAARTRIAARMHKETQRRKNALETSALPAKLADCRSDDVDRSELFVVEGDSALGTAKLARNSEFQALLPIRGKILNVQKASVADMFKNAECAALIQVVGAGTGRSFDLDAARYGKVIMMADADVDGSHIRTLLLTLFYRYMRPLVEAGRVYAAVPPLHRIEVIGQGRAKNEYVYTYTDAELKRTLADLHRRGKRIKEPVQRYKGLGEMDADQLAETTMDPRRRILRRISLGDAEAAEKTFDLLMGTDVAPRREYIVNSAALLDRSRIDA